MIDFSISKEKEALFIHIKNESDSTFYLHNGGRILHRIEDHRGSCIFISDKKKVKITVIITVRVKIIIELNSVNVLKHANCNINSIIITTILWVGILKSKSVV